MYTDICIQSVKVVAPLFFLAILASLVSAMVLKLLSIKFIESIIIICAYAFFGVFVGYSMGQSQQSLLASVFTLLSSILAVVFGAIFKRQSGGLDKYVPVAFISAIVMFFSMLVSAIYAAKVVNG